MITRHAGQLLDRVLAALAQTGQRAVLLSGWSGLDLTDLPPSIYPVDSIPHEWLFPRMAAIVHHGGAGTTAAALRAGIPSIVIPFTSDQPFWGWRVYHLGAGPKPIPYHQLTPIRLAQALNLATTNLIIQHQAANLGHRLRTEDGVTRAVERIETYLRN
jgi:UDP:flavonoid glycosyltransferase YjiC (YdhE family)